MNNEEILKKAIDKAVENGFVGTFSDIPKAGFYCEANAEESSGMCVYTNIFSHDFAKAFWGEGKLTADIFIWQQHLAQMVLEEEPLKYLESFL